ncbi:MAG: hypothetical protein LBJ01_01605 [Tannerella sp.]|jgi:hypothetical protein|nr:hypothetical protein [Tannerella sp.]
MIPDNPVPCLGVDRVTCRYDGSSEKPCALKKTSRQHVVFHTCARHCRTARRAPSLRLRGTKQKAIAEAGNPKQSVPGLAIASSFLLAMTALNGPPLQNSAPGTVIANAGKQSGKTIQ